MCLKERNPAENTWCSCLSFLFWYLFCFVLIGMGLGACPRFSCMKIMPFQDALLEVKGCSSSTCLKKITLSYGVGVPEVRVV